ncbi:1-aminocyclopropane-1-carboxylate deaminase/D-cysteine desulfhydrase [Pseudomonas sp. FME51]|uniref:1-aminocyclopropane-1-carboxylate deaminase/D-cysteine desulfhydrase n=1 Tax=Pseudomonas sp. FME51 TaxID=2742609 RepID=UPI0018663356|nr:pyridoxal-phosphate dependent enzyme [Pseudomonas sp. FME51]
MIASTVLRSPCYRLDRLSKKWNIDLWIKRDDLIPQFMGGNKVRKTYRILQEEIEMSGVPDVLITNGGAESNHARVVALMGAQLGCEVHLVLHGERPATGSARGNSFFYLSAGAQAHYVGGDAIAGTIAMIECQEMDKRRSVFVIPGGGHSHGGASAYAAAVTELNEQPDYIVHASGTGGTQAGLLLGIESVGWHSRVIGFSVARARDRGVNEIAKLLPDGFPREKLDFRDDFRFGGYEKFNEELVEFVRSFVREEGAPLDLTYTGKAMFGLHQLVLSGEIAPGSRVVFWHTGGLLNLTSTTL